MNDFTKEELKDLWMYIREFMGNGYDHPNDHKGYALMRKIQFIIDSYCEHSKSKRIMDTGEIDINFRSVTEENGTSYEIDIDASDQSRYVSVVMSRDDLKSFRNSIHNLLIDLNRELNYEE